MSRHAAIASPYRMIGAQRPEQRRAGGAFGGGTVTCARQAGRAAQSKREGMGSAGHALDPARGIKWAVVPQLFERLAHLEKNPGHKRIVAKNAINPGSGRCAA